ncbi:MAG: hypothetical protein JNJ71_08020 [Rubrivivax sp.]|nr:hypothetical protein [Rubrivivax sp.]
MDPLNFKRFKGNRFAEILLRWPCPQRVLMVTDDAGFGLDFGTGGFGLSEFVGIVRGAGHAVTTGHRNGHASASLSGNFNFATASTAVTAANYDQIWIFGFNTTALSVPEQETIARFMQAGGGVFATGDHESIGSGMGAHIPRVRRMRNWSSVPMFNQNRHDTVLDPGSDGVKQFDDQADAIAQRIYPHFFFNGGPSNLASSWSVHPVLRHASGAVDVLPDHAHESECLAPTPAAGSFAGVEEWPAPVGGGARIAPQVVAVSMSAGRFITDTLKPPVNPHSFGAISAYDGDAANVGRIVCDATWHHFVNINLNGSGAVADSAGSSRQGLYAAGVPTAEYEKIQRYFLNTVRWLAPKGRRTCFPFVISAIARFDFEIAELQLPRPHPCPWDPLLEIGRVAESVVQRHWGPGIAAEVVDGMLATALPGSTLSRVLSAHQPDPADKRAQENDASLLPVQDLRRVLLGSMINVLAQQLPIDEDKLIALGREAHDKLAAKLLTEAVSTAEPAIQDYLGRAATQLRSFIKLLQERK